MNPVASTSVVSEELVLHDQECSEHKYCIVQYLLFKCGM